MDREFELRNLSDFELLLLLLSAFLSNDVRECVDKRSLGSLFILYLVNRGSDVDVITCVVTSRDDYVRNVSWTE